LFSETKTSYIQGGGEREEEAVAHQGVPVVQEELCVVPKGIMAMRKISPESTLNAKSQTEKQLIYVDFILLSRTE
jgi:hypothetical protein